MKTTEVGDSLRELAAWFDAHPEAPVPYHYQVNTDTYDYIPSKEFGDVIRNIRSFTKEFSDSNVNVIVEVGKRKIIYYTSREGVCTKRVIGTKRVEAELIPARMIEAHDEEIVEWDCPESLLAKSENAR